MSLKLVELQVAIPRTQDVGKMQEQMQQRGQVGQDYLSHESQKNHEKKRKQVNENEKASKNKLNKDSDNGNNERLEYSAKKDSQDEAQNIQHPYKGAFLDIEG